MLSAIERRARENNLADHRRAKAVRELHDFAASWNETTDMMGVRSHASAILARHALKTADAGQLGAALVANEWSSGILSFVSLGRRLSKAAKRESLLLVS